MFQKALKNSQLISNIKLKSYHLSIKDLMHDPTLEGQDNNWSLLENLKTYCLWAHPFVAEASYDDSNEDENEVLPKDCK